MEQRRTKNGMPLIIVGDGFAEKARGLVAELFKYELKDMGISEIHVCENIGVFANAVKPYRKKNQPVIVLSAPRTFWEEGSRDTLPTGQLYSDLPNNSSVTFVYSLEDKYNDEGHRGYNASSLQIRNFHLRGPRSFAYGVIRPAMLSLTTITRN